MNPHALLAFLPAPLLAGALVLDLLRLRRPERPAAPWARALVGGGLAVAVLTAFTGLGARRRLASALPGDATPWDGHVIWAVVLLALLLAAGFVRLRTPWSGGERGSRLVLLLDAVLAGLAVTITLTGARTP